MKRFLVLFLILGILCGGCTSAPKQYTVTYLNLFDTVTTIVGASESEKQFQQDTQKIYEELASKEFIFIDKSYIANIEHVTSCQRGELFMRSGDVLPISRPRYQEVRKAIADYWRGMR